MLVIRERCAFLLMVAGPRLHQDVAQPVDTGSDTLAHLWLTRQRRCMQTVIKPTRTTTTINYSLPADTWLDYVLCAALVRHRRCCTGSGSEDRVGKQDSISSAPVLTMLPSHVSRQVLRGTMLMVAYPSHRRKENNPKEARLDPSVIQIHYVIHSSSSCVDIQQRVFDRYPSIEERTA